MTPVGGARGSNQYQTQGHSSAKPVLSSLDKDLVDQAAQDPGQTPLDLEAQRYLTPRYQHLQTRRELNVAEAQNMSAALVWLRHHHYNSPDDLLDGINLRDLHRRMFGDVWTWAGQTRRRETNIGVAPESIAHELSVALGNCLAQIEHHSYPEIEICVRLHHKLVYIHPFVNGNGRHARLVTNELGRMLDVDPLFVSRQKDPQAVTHWRQGYLAALETADATEDYGPLLKSAQPATE